MEFNYENFDCCFYVLNYYDLSMGKYYSQMFDLY